VVPAVPYLSAAAELAVHGPGEADGEPADSTGKRAPARPPRSDGGDRPGPKIRRSGTGRERTRQGRGARRGRAGWSEGSGSYPRPEASRERDGRRRAGAAPDEGRQAVVLEWACDRRRVGAHPRYAAWARRVEGVDAASFD